MTILFDCALVSCTATKQRDAAIAADLYASPWFVHARRIATEYSARWFILSAKHGLLEPHTLVAPYDQSLNALMLSERTKWGFNVWQSLKPHLTEPLSNSTVLLLAGQEYKQQIVKHLHHNQVTVATPLDNLTADEQLQYLHSLAGISAKVSDQSRFYEQLLRLRPAGTDFPRLNAMRARDLPRRGVYFFMEDGENRRLSPTTRRIVRIGTHAVSLGSKSSLWQRLRTHRGLDNGGGSHRSSIFRLHVGNCIRARIGVGPDTWAHGNNADAATRALEVDLEHRVSRYIGNLRVATLPILDPPGPDSDRSFIEMNAIALLTNLPIVDIPSLSWLGQESHVAEIRGSGLWNINYVGQEPHPAFLSVLEQAIDRITHHDSDVLTSIAPRAWRMNKKSLHQLPLFESNDDA